MLIKKNPKTKIKNLFFVFSEIFDQKYIAKKTIKGIPRPIIIYLGIN
tara:strand:- start:163 stop:303 length:141 start_codon:yes stop_codon:yes gene_type:complete